MAGRKKKKSLVGWTRKEWWKVFQYGKTQFDSLQRESIFIPVCYRKRYLKHSPFEARKIRITIEQIGD